MTSLSVAAASALTAPSSAARSVLPAGGASVQSGASSSASTFVTLGRSGAVADATNMQTYSASGAVPPVDNPPIWEHKANDVVTSLMAGNFSSSSSAIRFKGLGAALLDRFGGDGGDFSQSVLQFPPGVQAGTTAATVAQSQLHAQLDNRITLSIQTANGAQVDLTLGSQDNGLAVQVQVSKGKLTDAERDALQKLAGGFQDAIDGLAAVPPRLDLGGLTQFDPALLSSVDLHASVPAGGSDKQTIDFHADSKQRTVSANGPSGAMKVSVDTSNSAILGSAAQQKQAIDRYLKQFDAAQNRGHGDASLMGMFKDAFREMNSNIGTPQQQQQQRAQNPSAIWLNKTDQSMLTGLADFSASVTQNADWSNPMRRDESDTFSYQTSQNSSVKGSGQLNRSITQDQQSHLSASYHESLLADVPLKLSTDRQSQNYYYRQIKDDASSHASIAYDKGALVSASLKQTASQSTRVRKYVMGNLEEDTTTPSQATLSRDFLDLLKPLQKKETSHAPDDMNTLQQALSTINNLVYLQADPAQLRSEGLT